MSERDGIGSKFTERTGVQNQYVTEAEWQRRNKMERPQQPTPEYSTKDEYIKDIFKYMIQLEAYCNQLERDVKSLADIIEDQLALIESQLKIIELNPPNMNLITDEETILPDVHTEEPPYEKLDLWSTTWYNFKKFFTTGKKPGSPFDE
jgi:hypothetical protein